MTVSEMIEKLELTVFSGKEGLTKNIEGGYVSDLLSDVMGNASEGEVWIFSFYGKRDENEVRI